jgi:hypothetical protein
VYKASRRREYERLRVMDEEVTKEKEGEEFDKAKAEREERDREKTRKNREKREKMKARRGKGKGGGNGEGRETKEEQNNGIKEARVTGAPPRVSGNEADANDEAPTGVQEIGLIIHDDD